MVGGTHWNWGDRRFHGEGSLGLLRIRNPWVCLKDGFRVVGGDRERLSEVRTRTSHVSCWGGCSLHTGESRWRFSFRVMWSDLSCESESHLVVSNSLWPHGRPHGLYSPWNSSGQNTGVGSLSLLQELFPTRGSNPGLLHYRRILYQLSHKVQIPKPSNSSQFLRELLVHVYEKTHTWRFTTELFTTMKNWK